jgi:hypothetical protein
MLCSAGLALLLFRFSAKTTHQEGSNGYAALVFDASVSDRAIGERLAGSGVGTSYLSESSQSVFLNDLAGIQQVPLDEFQDRIESCDPRHDGYAEKLEAFFVRDGQRLFFVPLPSEMSKQGTAKIQAAFAEALGDIPFTIEYLGYDRPVSFYFALFAAACALSLLLSSSPLLCVVLLPLFAGFAFAGCPGLALAALLLAMTSIIVEPVREIFGSRRYGGGQAMRAMREKLRPKRIKGAKNWRAAVKIGLFCLLLALYVFIGIAAEIPLLLEAAVFAGAFCVLLLALWAESCQGKRPDHIRFMPVAIIGAIRKGPLITLSTIPFGVASFLALVLPHALGLNPYHDPGALGDPQYLIEKSEYENHVAFQQAFSLTSLGDMHKGGAFLENMGTKFAKADYVRYYLGDDGLIAGTKDYGDAVSADFIAEAPPFPLENLMDFLGRSGHPDTGAKYLPDTNSPDTGVVPLDFGIAGIDIREMLPSLATLLPCIISLLGLGQRFRRKKIIIYNEKRNLLRRRIAA